jgi:hypothetical protein
MGRPKGSRNKPKRGPGRPKGSKNKPKTVAEKLKAYNKAQRESRAKAALARKKPKKPKSKARSKDPVIAIRYAALKNQNENKPGWIPMVWNNKREVLSPWSHVSYDKSHALAMAKIMAKEEADHYSGDWDLSVKKK